MSFEIVSSIFRGFYNKFHHIKDPKEWVSKMVLVNYEEKKAKENNIGVSIGSILKLTIKYLQGRIPTLIVFKHKFKVDIYLPYNLFFAIFILFFQCVCFEYNLNIM